MTGLQEFLCLKASLCKGLCVQKLLCAIALASARLKFLCVKKSGKASYAKLLCVKASRGKASLEKAFLVFSVSKLLYVEASVCKSACVKAALCKGLPV